MLEGIRSLLLNLIPLNPSPMLSTNWLVEAKIIKFCGSSLNLFSLIWFEDIRMEPSLAIKYSHVERKNAESPEVLNSKLNLSNLLFKFSSKQQVGCSYQSFSSKILSKASKISSKFSQYKNLPQQYLAQNAPRAIPTHLLKEILLLFSSR